MCLFIFSWCLCHKKTIFITVCIQLTGHNLISFTMRIPFCVYCVRHQGNHKNFLYPYQIRKPFQLSIRINYVRIKDNVFPFFLYFNYLIPVTFIIIWELDLLFNRMGVSKFVSVVFVIFDLIWQGHQLFKWVATPRHKKINVSAWKRRHSKLTHYFKKKRIKKRPTIFTQNRIKLSSLKNSLNSI